jgi:putative phosphoesterase
MSGTDQSPKTTTTVAIISDTHTVLDPRIAEIISQADIAVHAGDIGDARVLNAMRPKSGRVIAVTGNNDHAVFWPSEQSRVVESMPEIARFDLPGGSVAVEHGHRHDTKSSTHQSLREAHPGAKLVVYGHTHHQVVDDTSLPWVVNPGAAGSTRTHGGPSYLLLTVSELDWKIERFKLEDCA